MCKGLRLGLVALVAWTLMPKAMAGDSTPQIRCKICVLRVSDACFEKLTSGDGCATRDSCCPAAGCATKCPAAGCCEAKSCSRQCANGECCDRACCEKPCGQCCQSSGCSKARSCAVLPPTVSQCQARRWMEMVRNCDCCEVICCPEVVTLNGQLGEVRLGSTQFFATGLNSTCINGESVTVPVNEPFPTGCCISVKASVFPGQPFTLLNLNAQFTELEGPAPLVPVVATARPCGEESESCPAVAFTQYLQQPSTTTRGVCKVFACPEGRAVVLDAGRRTVVRENESVVPVLGDLPVVGELFRCKTAEVVSDRLLVMVTPVQCDEACCETPTAATTSVTTEEVPLFAMPVMCGDWQRAVPASLTAPAAPVAYFYGVQPTVCPAPAAPIVAAPVEFLPIMPRPVPCTAPCPLPPPVASGVFVTAPCRAATPAIRAVSAATPATPCARCAAPACCASSGDAQLVNLLIEYYEACAARDTAKARNLAARCIALDPTCFAK